MTRTRVVLMAAWGLLALASVVQFVAADSPQTEGAEAADGPTDRRSGAATAAAGPDRAEPERLARVGDDPAPEQDRATVGSDRHTPDELVDPTGPDDPVATARPSTPSVVATVIGDGVASQPEPDSNAPTHWFPNPTQFGGDRTFLVVDDTSSETHVKVSLPVMPNGQEGWVARSEIELSTVEHRAEVDLSTATVTVWEGDRLILTTSAVTGRRSAPTPVGRFFVRDIIASNDPDGDFGPWILALSGFSEVLDTFDGGLPALALHGTDEPAQLGSALSSGCVRVPNDVITTLARTVPLGTPVTIVA